MEQDEGSIGEILAEQHLPRAVVASQVQHGDLEPLVVQPTVDRTVQDVVIRSDCRQLRITLEDGQTLLVSVTLDDAGKPRLDADLIRIAEESSQGQLEVRFDGVE